MMGLHGYFFMPTPRNSMRFRLYCLSGECLLMFFRGIDNHWMRLNFDTETHDFPRDAEIVGVWWDYERNAFMLRVHHASFDPVPEGEYPPYAGRLSVSILPNPSTESMAKELDERDAIIHDLREQLAGRGS